MRPPIKYALRQEGISETNTSKVYSNNIFTHSFNLVKKKIEQIVRSFRKNETSVATLLHYQEISDPDGPQLRVKRIDSLVSISDSQGHKIKFSAYLVPELRATLLDAERIHKGGPFNGKV